jgi:serine/threonine protein kinase
VGTILYEMLAGHCLFDGPNPFATLAAVTSCQVEPLRNHTPDVDPDLERVVLRSLEREPRDRYQSAKEFLQPLLAVARRDSRYLEGRILDLDPRLRQLA